jgi:hypothetical protein
MPLVFRALLGVAVLLLAGTSVSAAQISIAPRGGIAVAGGNFGDYLEAGPSGSLRIGYALLPGTSVFAEGGIDRFGSRALIEHTVTGPGMDMLRFVAGVEQELVPPGEPSLAAWSVLARAGGGVAKIDSDTYRHVDTEEDLKFSSTAPMATLGLSVGYTVGGLVTVFGDVGMNWARVDEEDTEALRALAPGYVKTFSSAWSFPYNVGLRIPF